MILKTNNLNINYEVKGKGQPIILLPGWLCSLEVMKPLSDALEDDYKVYSIDVLGFGKSSLPSKPLNSDDYGDFLNDFIKKLDIKNPILIGHSHGGRIIINYGGRYKNVSKIVLIASAGLKPHRKLSYYIKVGTYKFLKNFLAICPNWELFNNIRKRYLNKFGSEDYKNSPAVLKKTMAIILNEDERNLMKNIKVKTLLIWGEKDKTVLLHDAYIMKEHLKNSQLAIIKNAGHYPFLDSSAKCINLIKNFLKEE